jgi:cell division protease FtsH
MSSLGTLTFGRKDDMIFLGRELAYHSEYSEETARKIDLEIKKVIDKAYQNAEKIIIENKKELEAIAKLLLEKESLSSDDIDNILKKKKKKSKPAKKNSKARTAGMAANNIKMKSKNR